MLKPFLFLVFISMGVGSFAQNRARFSAIKPCMPGGEDIICPALRVANDRAANLRCPEVYTKGVILSCDWDYGYDSHGCIRSRKIHLELYCDKPDGCGMAEFTFKQKYEGNGYFADKFIFDRVGYMYNVECE